MSTVSIIFRKNKVKKDGTSPIYLRLIKNRKTRFISTGINIYEKHWDDDNKKVKTNHPNSNRINALITKKKYEAEELLIDSETNPNVYTKEHIGRVVAGRSSRTFTDLSNDYLRFLEEKKSFGTLAKSKGILSKIHEYYGEGKISFSTITYDFLKNYERYLRVNKKNSTNTIHTNMRLLRKLMNDSIREGIVKRDNNPFNYYEFKLEKTDTTYLTEEELHNLRMVELEDDLINIHRDIYVFACYVGGLRISDVLQLKFSNLEGDKIIVKTQKTKSTVSIKLPNIAWDIIEKYRNIKSKSDDYIFPLLTKTDILDERKLFYAISAATALTNKNLKLLALKAKIKKKLTFHTSRHTWATRALRKGMRIEYVSKLLGHSNLKMTQHYAKIVDEELDKAMDIFND